MVSSGQQLDPQLAPSCSLMRVKTQENSKNYETAKEPHKHRNMKLKQWFQVASTTAGSILKLDATTLCMSRLKNLQKLWNC